MAPPINAKGVRHGGYHRAAIRGSKGGGALRSNRGGARGGKGLGKGTEKNIFYSTRVEEQSQEVDDKSDEDNGFQEDNEQSVNVSDSSSDGELDNVPGRGHQTYNVLLESLGARDLGEPRRKKPRLENDQKPAATFASEEDGAEKDVDEVVEPEVVEESEMEGDDEPDEADENKDPFTKHFSDLDEATLAQLIDSMSTWSTTGSKSFLQERWIASFHGAADQGGAFSRAGNTMIRGIHDLYLKKKLQSSGERLLPQFVEIFATLATSIFNYKDILFPHRTLDNADTLRNLSCLHALNHLFKTRDRIIKNNARLARDDTNEDLELRDQGFTRPKVLIILPSRHSCLRYVETIISLCEPEQQENRKRFQDSYANSTDNMSESKPLDFQELFEGNDDDLFRLGMKFTRKTIKFFSQFYNSDIIFASPLGLRMALGVDEPKKQDHDFLSSIEIVIVDQADAIAMQNWEHMEYIFEHLNLQPKEIHGCDFSRVRHWYLDGRAKYLRQTILMSAFNFPALNKVFTKTSLNIAGKIKYHQKIEGAMVDISFSVKQTISRFESKSPANDPDDRFRLFSSSIIPFLSKHARFRPGSSQGILIFISSYADFVRVRNYLASSPDTQNISFGSISEYTSVSEVARARSHFLSGRHSVLLYTERAHHFRRHHLKGVKKVIMYALPENPIFYKELVGEFLQSSVIAGKATARETSVRALFSRLDMMKVERIVGSSRLSAMLKDQGGDTFVFE